MNLPSKTTVSSADYISHLFTDFPRQQINPKYIDIWHIQHILCVDLTAFGIFTDQWSKLSNRHTFSDLIIWHTKGRVTLPKRKNFRTISNGRCPPYPLIFRKLCCNFFFSENNICNIGLKMIPHPLEVFQKIICFGSVTRPSSASHIPLKFT